MLSLHNRKGGDGLVLSWEIGGLPGLGVDQPQEIM